MEAVAAAGELNPDLISTIHEVVLPQLMLAQASEAVPASSLARGDKRAPPTDVEVERLATLALDGDVAGARAFVASILDDGVSVQSALLLLVAPAARTLQAEWIADECSFSEVAAALGLIHQLVSALAPRPETPPPDEPSGEKIRT